ncbi:MAG: ADP-forming succinate--CoA ligase subunit beta [Alphaproteobacteria bacterium]
MDIHEYQAKQLLGQYHILVPSGLPVVTVAEAKNAADQLGGELWIVKAQIHAGGRGKAGGVIIAHGIDEVTDGAAKLLGKPLVTAQTGPDGQIVNCVYIEKACMFRHEFYLSLVVDRSVGCITIVACASGGMDIEEVAISEPQKILRHSINPLVGVQSFHAREIAGVFGLDSKTRGQLDTLLKQLYRVFIDKDASLIEINPLVLASTGDLVVLDAKMSFDDNSLYRQPDILALQDRDALDALEIEASRYDISYIKLNGTIGCMVNGAGLAMATMDIIKLHGGFPANFLDVGGGATREKVAAALKIILADVHVEAILVNIFGGIMHCDVIAEGIIAAAKEVAVKVPLVVRLQGTNAAEGRRILEQSGLKIITADDLKDAAIKVVAARGQS